MNLRYLNTFSEIVRRGSFFKAAQSLGYAQATVSQQIHLLERELNVSLFLRNGKKIELSAAGEALYQQANDLLGRAEVVESSVKNFGLGDGGVLRIAASEPIASQRIMPLLGMFRASRPHLKILFEVSGAQANGALVASGKIDIACGVEPAQKYGLTFERLYDEELRALVPVNHPAAHKPTISLQEICSEQLILTECECRYRQLFEGAARQCGEIPSPHLQVSSVATAFAAVENGLGIAILPRVMAINSSRVIVKRLGCMGLFLPIGLITRPDPVLPPCAEQFIELLRIELKRGPTDQVRVIAV